MSERSAGTPCSICQDKDGHWISDHEDELVVADTIVEAKRRCLACGRRFSMRLVPGDFVLGGDPNKPASAGARGRGHLIATPDVRLDELWDPRIDAEPAIAYWTLAPTLQDVSKLVRVLCDADPAFGLYDVHVRQKMPIGERIEIEFCSSLDIDRVRDLLTDVLGDDIVAERLGATDGVIWRAKAG